MPEDITGVLKKLSDVKGRSPDEIETIAQNNSMELLGSDWIDTQRISI